MYRATALLLLTLGHLTAAPSPPITFERPDYTLGNFLVASATASQVDRPFDGQAGWSRSTSAANRTGSVVSMAASGEYVPGQAVTTSADTIITAKKGYVLMDPETRLFTFDMRGASTFSFGLWKDLDADGLFEQTEAQLMWGTVDTTPKSLGMRGPSFSTNHSSGVAVTASTWYRWVIHIGVPDVNGTRVVTTRVRNLTSGADVDFDAAAVGAQPWMKSLTKGEFGAEPEECDGIVLRITTGSHVDNINGPVPPAEGDVVQWDGGGADGNWATAANWLGDVAPVEENGLIFSGTVQPDSMNDFPEGTGFGGLRFLADTTVPFTLSGNGIRLNGPVQSFATGTTVHTLGMGMRVEAVQSVMTSVSTASVDCTGVISGAGGLNKMGTGTLNLRGVNTFTGGISANAGKVFLFGDQSAATGSLRSAEGGLITVDAAAVAAVSAENEIRLASATATVAGLTVNGALTNSGGLLCGRGGSLTVNGSMVQNGAMEVESVLGSTTQITINAGGVLSYGGGTPLTLKSSTGTAGIARVTVVGRLETAQALDDTSTGTNVSELVLRDGGELRLTGPVAAVAGDIRVLTGLVGSVINTNGHDTVMGAAIADSTTAGARKLIKRGAGLLSLTGARTTAAGTLVEEGTLSVNRAAFADAADVELSAGTTLNLDFTGADTVDEFFIAGVAQAQGEWGAQGSGAAHQSSAITGTGRLLVTKGPVITTDAFVEWMDAFVILTNAADKTKAADPDGDGWNNLAEFSFGSDPTAGGSRPLVFSATENTGGDARPEALLVVAVRSGAVFSGSPAPSAVVDGVTYTMQGALDPAGFGAVGAPVVTPLGMWTGQPAPAGWQWQRFRLEGSEGLPGKGFLRAKVTAP